jgi:hypothetical protein
LGSSPATAAPRSRPASLCPSFYWVVGQQFAGLLTGSATDISSAPLFILMAIALWPGRSAVWRQS